MAPQHRCPDCKQPRACAPEGWPIGATFDEAAAACCVRTQHKAHDGCTAAKVQQLRLDSTLHHPAAVLAAAELCTQITCTQP